MLCVAVLVLVLAAGCVDGARILGLFPLPAKSHYISFSPLMQELARRGHQVTVVSGFPLDPPLANHTDITVHSSFPENAIPNLFKMQETSTVEMFTMIWDLGLQLCERELKHPSVQKLIEDKSLEFDLIIMEIFLNECFYGLVHKFKAPVIQISSNTITLWMGDGVGNPHTTSYIPDVMLGFPPHMSFSQRLQNTIMAFFFSSFRALYYLPRQYQVMQKYFKDPTIPSIPEIERTTSLLLLNSHFSLSYPRPFTPNTIEVGGMHIKPGKKLPKDLQKFMDDAVDGVVYFSLGSNVRSKDMPEAMKQAFLDAFSKIKQKVLWKWEADAIEGLPKNVHISKWVPQNDILTHPNLRVFMTHSGLLSTQEATYHGVPMLAIPVAGDQVVNAKSIQAKGCAVMLELTNITSQSVLWALEELMSNPRYRENVKLTSALFRDQPQSPLDRAVYWTEYVIRHQGAPHLRSAALDLWWFEYYLLDVLALILGAGILIAVIAWMLCRTLYRQLCSKSTVKKSKKTN